MRKRRLFLVLIGGVVCVGMLVELARFFRSSREPEYGGKKLSHYVEFLGSSVYGRIRRLGMDSPSVDAIDHIGTNAIPFLLEWIRYEPPKWRTDLYAILNAKFGWDLVDTEQARTRGALMAFELLGPKAQGAVPDLVRIMAYPKETEDPTRAVDVLVGLGHIGLPALLTALTNRPSRQQTTEHIIRSLYRLGTNAQAAVPVLKAMLGDPQPGVSNAAVYALADIDPKSLGFVPPVWRRAQVVNRAVPGNAGSAVEKAGEKDEGIEPVERRSP